MIGQLLKVIGSGILGGIFLFAIPFIVFKTLFIFLLAGLFFRMLASRQVRKWIYYHLHQQGKYHHGF